MNEETILEALIPAAAAGERIDRVLAQLFPQYSRARLQLWLEGGFITLDGHIVDRKVKLRGGEHVRVQAQPIEADSEWAAQPIALNIVYEDNSIIIVNKPAGLVVHPAVGNRDGTLVNALLHYAPELAAVPRAGIVHRLDKDTSGLLAIARGLEAHRSLVSQLQARSVTREYDALVTGEIISGDTIDAPMGRHPGERKKMAVVVGGKQAVTHFRVLERYMGATLLRVRLETGRTHQIRVHMAHCGHPVVGDPVYGGIRLLRGIPEETKETVFALKRQALHAARLELRHPESDKVLHWQVARPGDFEAVLDALRPFPKQADEWT